MSHILQDGSVTAAYVMLIRDARHDQVTGVSAQTLLALSLGMGLRYADLTQQKGALFYWFDFIVVSITMAAGLFCSCIVAKRSDAGSEDEILQNKPRWMSVSAVYVMAACMTLVAMLSACHGSIYEVDAYVRSLPTALSCTFENFLHGTALLPQLILSRQRGFVAPAACKLLLILGVKHICELADDLAVSYRNLLEGSFNTHEASFLSGDLFAALVLLDFLYLFVASRLLAKPKSKALEAARDILTLMV